MSQGLLVSQGLLGLLASMGLLGLEARLDQLVRSVPKGLWELKEFKASREYQAMSEEMVSLACKAQSACKAVKGLQG